MAEHSRLRDLPYRGNARAIADIINPNASPGAVSGAERANGADVSMKRPVFETTHDNLYGNALLRYRKLMSDGTYHQARLVDGFGCLLTPSALRWFQMIDQSDAHGKRAVLLDNVSM